jgi:hypothetical protein
MAYTFDTNNTITTGAEAIYNLKEALKTAGWTVASSSDASTYNDSGDQITSGSSGVNGMDNARAWFRIQMPTSQGAVREFTFQRSQTYHYQWRIKYSYSAGFTGGSPDATTTPSATDEQILNGGGTDASPSWDTLFATSGTWRHSCAAGGSDELYVFYSMCFLSGGGSVTSTFIWEAMTANSYPTEDIDPYVLFFDNTSPDDSAFSNVNTGTQGYLDKGGGSESFTTIPALTHEDSVSQIEVGLPSNPHTGKDDLLPMVYARRAALGGTAGYKGIGYMMRWLGISRTVGDTITVSSSRDKIVFGDVAFPWDGSTPTI